MNDAQKHNQKIASERLSRLVKLVGSEDYRWFLGECVVKEMKRLSDIIHNRRDSTEAREQALSEWTALERVRLWVQTEANDAGKTLGHEHRIILDITAPKPPSEPNP